MVLARNLAAFGLAVALAFGISASSHAEERGTAKEAQAMAEKAIAHIKQVGNEKAFADFTAKDAGWQSKDLYVFALKFDGYVVGHGANKALVGKSLYEIKDPSGKSFIKEFIEVAKNKGSGWVEYHFADPQTKRNLPKSSYIIRIPGYDGFAGVGIYK